MGKLTSNMEYCVIPKTDSTNYHALVNDTILKDIHKN